MPHQGMQPLATPQFMVTVFHHSLIVSDAQHLGNGSLGLRQPLAGAMHVKADVSGVHNCHLWGKTHH